MQVIRTSMSAASLAIVAPFQPNARPSQKPELTDDAYAVRIAEHKRGSHHPMRHCAQYYAQEIRYRHSAPAFSAIDQPVLRSTARSDLSLKSVNLSSELLLRESNASDRDTTDIG